MVQTLSLTSHSPEETAQLARSIAPKLRAGDTLLLEGQIGGGKTHFARNLIHSLIGDTEDVPSPTFTLVQTYEGPGCEIWHSDLYRLSHPDEVFELGLIDAFSDALCLIEWPDRLGDLRPESALTLGFSTTEMTQQRVIDARWSDPRWDILKAMFDV